jgi:hypothetical protein
LAKREFGFCTRQTAKTFSSFTVISFVDRIEGCFPFQSRLRRSFAPHATTPVYLPRKFEEKRGKSESFISEISDSPRFLPF